MSAPESAIGLEIGTHYVKVVRLVQRFGRPYLATAEMLRLPNDRNDMTEVIRLFLESKELLKYPCAICTPAYSSMLHTIDIAENDPRSGKDVVSIEIERLNDISEESMLYDFVKLPESPVRQSILIAMGREAAIQRMLHIPDAIGLEVVSVMPIPIASFNGSFPRDIHSSDVVVCANISRAATHVAIGSRNGILFSRHFDHGGDLFTEAIAKSMDIGHREAEDLKIRHGFSIDEAHAGSNALQALQETADGWIAEIESTLFFYHERFSQKEEQPQVLVLSGGGAGCSGLTQYVAAEMSIEVRAFEPPWSGRKVEHAGRFAIAGGLALAVLKKTRMQLNILPPDRKDALHLRSQIPYWKAIGVTLSLAILICIAGRLVNYKRDQTYAESLSQRLEGFQSMNQELDTLKKENARLNGRLRFAHRGMRDGMILRAIVGAIASVMNSEDWLILTADSKSYFARQPAPARRSLLQTDGETPATDPESHFLEGIIIEGYTPHEDFATVKTMIEKLRVIPYVENVDLLTDDKVISDPERDAQWEDLSARLFAIEIKVRKP